MQAKSIHGNSQGAISIALEQSMSDGFKPTLAIVFISIKQDRKAICEILHDNGIDILGATSAGEFINGYQNEGSAVILLLDIKKDTYTILFEDVTGKRLSDSAEDFARVALTRFEKPAFILCSTGLSGKGEFLDGEMLVRGIEKVVGPAVNIYGGMAGDDITMTGTYVFTYQKETDAGMAALVLDEHKIDLYGMAISGWKPIGISRTVTKSEGNLVYTIDDQPALEMYLKYLGKTSGPGENKYKIFEDIGVHYPFQLEKETGSPVMRTPIAVDTQKNALVCDFTVPQGSKLRFSMPPDFDIVERVVKEADQLKNDSGADAEALLIFSCAGRLSVMGPLAQRENEGLSEIWRAPMAGFYTYGEYGRAINGKQEFHSTTCSWVALREKRLT